VRGVSRQDYAEETAGREYFEQALIDGIVLVFHSWHRDPEALQ
jgi:hypothetical protein